MTRIFAGAAALSLAVLFVRAQAVVDEDPSLVGSYQGAVPQITVQDDGAGLVVSVGAFFTFKIQYNSAGYHDGTVDSGVAFIDGSIYTLSGEMVVVPFPKDNKVISYSIEGAPQDDSVTPVPFDEGILFRSSSLTQTNFDGSNLGLEPAPKRTKGRYIDGYVTHIDTDGILGFLVDGNYAAVLDGGGVPYSLYVEAKRFGTVTDTLRERIRR
jgi:hypothetical protein